jgi:hypothetical protein
MARHPLSQQCGAMAKGTGARCEHWVIAAPVCHVHGGAAGQVRAKREGRILEWQAAAGSATEPRDPSQALLAAARDADAISQRLRRALAAGETSPSVLLSTVGEWLDRVARLSKLVVDARLDERRAALDAERAQLVRIALQRAVAAAELDAATRVVVLRAFAAELRVGPHAEDQRPSVQVVPEIEP